MENEETPQSSWWQKQARQVLLFTLFLTPILFLPVTQYPVSLNQQSFVFLAVPIILALVIASLLAKGEIRFPGALTVRWLKIPTWIFLFIFMVGALASLFLAPSPQSALWGLDGSEPDSILSLLLGILIFLLVLFLLPHQRERTTFIKFLFLASEIALGIFIINNLILLLAKRSLFSFMANSSFNTIGVLGMFAAFIGLGFLIVLIRFVLGAVPQDRRAHFRMIAILVLSFLTLVGLAHRPTFFALVATLACFIILYLRRWPSAQLSKFNLVAFFIFVFLIVTVVRLPILALFNLPIEVSLTHKSSVDIIGQTLRGSLKQAIFGVGPSGFIYQYPKLKPIDINNTPLWNFDFRQPSSFWLTLAVSFGLVGLLSLLGWFLSLTILSLRTYLRGEEEDETTLILLTLWIYLAFLSFLYPFNFLFIVLFFAVAGCVHNATATALGRTINVSFAEVKLRNVLISFLLIALLIGSFILLIFGARRYTAYVIADRALKGYARNGDLDAAGTQLQRAFVLHSIPDFARTLGNLWFEKLRVSFSQATPSTIEGQRPKLQQQFNSAVAAMQAAIQLDPQNYLYWLNFGGIYEQLIPVAQNSHTLALQSYQRAFELAPHHPFTPVNLARVEIIRADNNSAIRSLALSSAEKNLKQAIELKSDYNEAYLLLAQVYGRQGRMGEAIRKIEAGLQSNPRNIGLLFQLGYFKYQQGDFSGAKNAFITLLGLNPNYSNAKYYLGLTYDRLGDRANAARELEEVLSLNPNNPDVLRALNSLGSGQTTE